MSTDIPGDFTLRLGPDAFDHDVFDLNSICVYLRCTVSSPIGGTPDELLAIVLAQINVNFRLGLDENIHFIESINVFKVPYSIIFQKPSEHASGTALIPLSEDASFYIQNVLRSTKKYVDSGTRAELVC